MKSKIKETKYPKTDSRGSSCLVVMEDGKEGFFNYKGDFPFTPGQEVEYEATSVEKKTKPGEFYNQLKISKVGSSGAPAPTPAPTPSIPSVPTSTGKDPLEAFKLQTRTQCIALAHGAYMEGKLSDDEAKNHCREWVVMADALIDDLKK